MLGELEAARQSFLHMREQALAEGNTAYPQVARAGLARISQPDDAVAPDTLA